MQNDAATVYCSNDACQTPNPLSHKYCQQCRTPLTKRYLWAVGDDTLTINPGEELALRYLAIGNRIFLDTKPALVPDIQGAEIPAVVKPYLRLIPYRLNLPQAYGVLSKPEILLLEEVPIYTDGVNEGQLMPELTTAWKDASSMRQLNWLWQIAALWQPMSSEGVASSLMIPEVLRVEGSLVRLLYYHNDQEKPTLAELGKFWLQLLNDTRSAIALFLAQVCHSLIDGEIRSSGQLSAILDRGLAEVGREQTAKISIATKSDTGPSRQRNEDACYPASGNVSTKPPHAESLAIVCDGIGGHEGGNVASNLAIETIRSSLQPLTNLPYDHVNQALIINDLENAASVANDRISHRNDLENRQGRQRMGTTLVMALALSHEVYIAHVGDSRAYWITSEGCHQVTLDDDVASREVRLGYGLYRDAVQQTSAGSLVQALGMNSSGALHPTAQRFILDQDCVFLLASDGLSDFDRVDQYWETEILPLLEGKIEIATIAERLIELANTQNGHDNVTVGLVHYQVQNNEPKTPISASVADVTASLSEEMPKVAPEDEYQSYGQTSRVTAQPTQVLNIQKPKSKLPLILGTVLFLLLGGGVFAYLWGQRLSLSVTQPSPAATPSIEAPVQQTQTPQADPAVGTNQQSTESHILPERGSVIHLQHKADDKKALSLPVNLARSVTEGTFWEVTNVTAEAEDYRLKLRICPAKTAEKTKPSNFSPRAQEESIKYSQIKPYITSVSKPANPNSCGNQNAAIKAQKASLIGKLIPKTELHTKVN